MDKIVKNQMQHASILAFDPIYRKKAPRQALPSNPMIAPTQNEQAFENYPGYVTYEDGTVEFRVYAPEANSVIIKIDLFAGGDIVLEKGDDGYWRKRVEGVLPGYHWTNVLIDGNTVIVSDLPSGYTNGAINYIDVPDPKEDYFTLKADVPHGSITWEIYESKITGRLRSCWVYTPAGYTENTDKRYPVVYVNHGGGSEATTWFWQAKLNYIADNLIAEGKAEPMIIVCNSNNAFIEQEDGLFIGADAAKILSEECVPFIDGKYRTIANRHARAVSGLSAGGGLSRHMVHRYPETFANLGCLSSGAGFLVKGNAQGVVFDYSDLFKTPEFFNNYFDVTFVAVGQQDMRVEYTKPQVKELIDQGYNIVYKDYPGGHEFNVWRQCMRDFLPMLFKNL